jgi:hypothetical protein
MGPHRGFVSAAGASNGSDILVAWSNNRLFLTRIGLDGALLDNPPIFLSPPLSHEVFNGEVAPLVAWNGERYLLIWQIGYNTIEGQFVGRDGSPLGPRMLLFQWGGSQGHRLATNGDSFLVVDGWKPSTAKLVFPDSTTRTVAGTIESVAAVASDGDSYLLLTKPRTGGPAGSAAHRVARDGTMTKIDLETAGWESLAWAGSHYLAKPANRNELHRLDRDGRPIGEPILFPVHPAIVNPEIIARGSDAALLALTAADGIELARLDGVTLRIGSTVIPGRSPRLVRANGATYLLWIVDAQLRHARVDETTLTIAPTAGEATALTAPSQHDARSAPTSAGFFAVWEEARAEGVSLLAATVTRLGDSGSEIHVAQIAGASTAPSVASGGEVVLVAWYDAEPNRGVWARRFTSGGIPLDPEPFRVAAELAPWGRSGPALAWNGETFVIAWSMGTETRVARVAPTGLVLDPGGVAIHGRLPIGDWPQRVPGLASTGGTTLLVWQEGDPPQSCHILCVTPPPPEITAIRLDRNLGFLDPAPFGIGQAAFPSVAANDGIFAVAVVDLAEGARVVRIDADGDVLDTPAIGSVFRFQSSHYGSEVSTLLVAEGVEISRAPGGFLLTATEPLDAEVGARAIDRLHLAYLPAHGAPHSPIVIETGGFVSSRPHASARDDGTMLLLYSAWRNDVGTTLRATYRLLRPLAPPRGRMVIR